MWTVESDCAHRLQGSSGVTSSVFLCFVSDTSQLLHSLCLWKLAPLLSSEPKAQSCLILAGLSYEVARPESGSCMPLRILWLQCYSNICGQLWSINMFFWASQQMEKRLVHRSQWSASWHCSQTVLLSDRKLFHRIRSFQQVDCELMLACHMFTVFMLMPRSNAPRGLFEKTNVHPACKTQGSKAKV